MGYLAIRNAIVVKLQAVTSVKIVYDKEAKLLEQFPAACVSAKSNQADFHTIGSGGANKYIYEHYVRLYFPVDDKDDSDYEEVLETVADAVITALANDVTLGGTCLYSIPVSGEWRFGDKEVPTRMLEIVVQSTVHAMR